MAYNHKMHGVNVWEFTILVWIGSLFAGLLGSLTGLGGGVVVIPLLTLVFHVDIHYAIGASMICIIATSSGAAAAYVKEGFTNIRIGMLLEIATTIGAIGGAFLSTHIPAGKIAVVFGIILIISAFLSVRHRHEHQENLPPHPLAVKLKLNSTYPTSHGPQPYTVQGVPAGFSLMFLAGGLAGMLGIGGGAFKVLGMDQMMKLPFKVSTTTSNFMIGVTAAASSGFYLTRGYVDPGIAMPVMLGVLLGSMIGAKILIRTKTTYLRRVFSIVIIILALEMIYHGLMGKV